MHSAAQLCSQDFILLLLSLQQAYIHVQLVSMPVFQHAERNGHCSVFRQQDMLLVMLLGTAAQSLCGDISFACAVVMILK